MPRLAKIDPHYDTAKQLILDTREPSISLLQRHLKIGYNRAQNLMVSLEGDIVTTLDKAGRRKMLNGESAGLSVGACWMNEIEWPYDGSVKSETHLHVICRCFSQSGKGKELNGDAILLPGFVQLDRIRESGTIDLSKPRCFAIAGRVSMHSQAAIASSRLLIRLNNLLHDAAENTSLSELLHRLQRDFATMGDKLKYIGMTSTIVGVRLVANTATIFNVGDSRAYLLTNSANGCQAKLLSRDHNVLNDMLEDGDITREQAKNTARIYRGLTSHFIADPAYDELRVNIVTHTMQKGERLLLCSDGLTEVLSDFEIAALFAENSDKALLKAFMASRRAGGVDDFSVIVLETVKNSTEELGKCP